MEEKKENIVRSATATGAKTTVPVVMDLGKQSKSDIKKLENGEGKLMLEVEIAVDHARARLPDEDKNKIIVPVVIIYRKKQKRGGFPISPLSPFNFFR
ncbi:MAG TPA: hypothetical protein VI756_10215 [Blastocatellia bacterium]